jgi:hypothetical protein
MPIYTVIVKQTTIHEMTLQVSADSMENTFDINLNAYVTVAKMLKRKAKLRKVPTYIDVTESKNQKKVDVTIKKTKTGYVLTEATDPRQLTLFNEEPND